MAVIATIDVRPLGQYRKADEDHRGAGEPNGDLEGCRDKITKDAGDRCTNAGDRRSQDPICLSPQPLSGQRESLRRPGLMPGGSHQSNKYCGKDGARDHAGDVGSESVGKDDGLGIDGRDRLLRHFGRGRHA